MMKLPKMSLTPNLLKMLGETNPINDNNLSLIRTVSHVNIHSNQPGFFTESDILLQVQPPSLLSGLQLILSEKSPISVADHITGWYHQLFQVAWVKLNRPESEIKRSILHESGHHIWQRLPLYLRDCFEFSTRKVRGGNNDWAIVEERFADGVALFVLGAATAEENKVVDAVRSALT